MNFQLYKHIIKENHTKTHMHNKKCNHFLDNSPGALLTRLLSESAAPLAGLSAATIAYGAAAMLPIWLPAALGKKKRRRKRQSEDENMSAVDTFEAILTKAFLNHDLD